MKTVLIGVGQAGGKVAHELARYDTDNGYGAVVGALGVNSASADLQSLPFETVLIGQDRVNGHGVGGDNELGASIMQSDAVEVMDALDGQLTAAAEAIVVVAGLGGGTGSGGAPVLVRELQRIYDVPVYALGVLPGRDEGSIYQVNAGRSLKTLVREADSLLVIDNDAWRDVGESVEEGYGAINRAIAERVGLLLAAGEIQPGEEIAESVVDTSEVINTLRGGGLAAVGAASAVASEDAEENVNTVTTATRNALFTGTSLPEADTADAALLIVSGEPERIPRKGVERARRWLEEETGSMQVRGGDYPQPGEEIRVTLLLSGVQRSERVEQFMARARQAQAEADDLEQERDRDPAAAFQNDQLDDLL
ncbi:MAG: tubulin/FtsZ family protein [Haloferacaceae archaeon]